MAVAALAAPAAKEGLEAAGKFWKSLLDDLGKPAYESTKVYAVKKDPKEFRKVGKRGRVEYHRSRFPGLVVERTAGKRVESVVIPRWAALAVVATAGVALASAAEGGSAALKGKLPKLYYGTTVGKLHEPILNFAHGIHIPLP